MRRLRLKTGNEGWLTSYADLITNLIIFFVVIIAASNIQKSKLEAISEAITQKASPDSLSQAHQKIQEVVSQSDLKGMVEISLKDDGLELSFNSGVMFASGGAEILSQMNQPLEKVLKLLVPYADKYHFAIEGHTDEVPTAKNSSFHSNWELGAKRALEVRARLEAVGIARDKMRVEAYADTRPLSADQVLGLNHDQVLAKHRRVVIRLY